MHAQFPLSDFRRADSHQCSTRFTAHLSLSYNAALYRPAYVVDWRFTCRAPGYFLVATFPPTFEVKVSSAKCRLLDTIVARTIDLTMGSPLGNLLNLIEIRRPTQQTDWIGHAADMCCRSVVAVVAPRAPVRAIIQPNRCRSSKSAPFRASGLCRRKCPFSAL